MEAPFESPLLFSLGLFPLFSTDRHSRVLKLPCTALLFSLSGSPGVGGGGLKSYHVPEITWPGTRASLEAFEKVKGAGLLSGDRHGQVSPWFPSSFLPVKLTEPPPHPSLLPPSQPHSCLQKPERESAHLLGGTALTLAPTSPLLGRSICVLFCFLLTLPLPVLEHFPLLLSGGLSSRWFLHLPRQQRGGSFNSVLNV